nr:hypothetical protein [Tanacetum cinerariifolium]
GNGEDTLFWEDSWFDGISLKQQFPRLYSLELAKHINVAEKINHPSLSWFYHREPRGGFEEEQQNMLFSRISGVILPNMRDRWIWSFEASGDFLVTSARRLIEDYLLPKGDVQTRWVKVVPIKINVFAWRVLTRLNLSLRGVETSFIMSPLQLFSGIRLTHFLYVSYHTKKISQSVFVTNFPDSTNSGDLWKVCSAYGTVIDVFIPNKKAKSGKRFAFVRFIKGVPLHVWSRETFTRIGKKWGEVVDLEDNEDSSFAHKRLCIKTKHAVSILEAFKIIVKGKVFMVRAKELFSWNPIFLPHKEMVISSDDESVHSKFVQSRSRDGESSGEGVSDDEEIAETIFDDNSPSHNHCGEMGDPPSQDPFKTYDLLKKKSIEVVRESSPSLTHLSGFTPDCVVSSKANGHETEGSARESTKSSKSSFNAKVMNSSQEVHTEVNSDYVGLKAAKYGGSMLEVMEEMIRVGQVMGSKILFVAIYAPHAVQCKRILWDYVMTLIGRWKGETIIMGDFNEVRSKDERRGSIFNPSSSRHFDRFISLSGLVDVKLEGLAFTWSHPSRSKMSKLYHFLVSHGIISLFPSITAVCLDRHLSDHRPILLHEAHTDFGPTPFRFYHSWFELAGFDDLVEQKWRSNELHVIDKELDNGVVSDASLLRRLELNRQLNEINAIETKDFIQKSKVKWAIEGDENSKFSHGLINLKQSQLAIRGVFIDGLWCTDPAVEYFFEYGSFPKGCNYSFVALILKVTDAKLVNDFQPISLIGCVYKVVTKILAIWLVMVIPDLIFDTQSAFVAGRQILDGPFILNEILHWCKRKNKQVMFFKVDFAKAYDSVRWDYLLDMLEGFGFGQSWCKWIRGTFSSAKASVLVIGSPFNEFSFHCGLKQAWEDTIVKLKNRLSKWKAKTLSIGGRLTLLKSVLDASPFYSMSIFKVPRGILKAMEAIRNNFFIGADPSVKKITWVAWDKVLASKNHGGLGSHSVNSSSIWSSILRELQSLKDKGFDFGSHCKKRIGNGQGTRFWVDIWISDIPLCLKFPHLFALELDKHALVAVKMIGSLDHSFHRTVRDGMEQQQMSNLILILESVSLSTSQNQWICDLSGDGEFRAKEVRIFLDDLFLPSFSEPTRWVKCVPIKINIFAWRARRDCLPTRSNLARRGISLESSRCPLCDVCEEDIHHVLFWCSLAQLILRRICRWWELEWQPWISFSEWQVWFSTIRILPKVKRSLEGVFYVAWWSIWNLRNHTVLTTFLQDNLRSLMILCLYLLLGVIANVIDYLRGRLG